MREATRVILQLHQIVRLPRKINLMIDRAPPATKNESHAEFSSHMKRYLQCVEQHMSPSNLTKYCACHEK